jgi:hypothetical protein
LKRSFDIAPCLHSSGFNVSATWLLKNCIVAESSGGKAVSENVLESGTQLRDLRFHSSREASTLSP